MFYILDVKSTEEVRCVSCICPKFISKGERLSRCSGLSLSCSFIGQQSFPLNIRMHICLPNPSLYLTVWG